jgi:hypothetical protein
MAQTCNMMKVKMAMMNRLRRFRTLGRRVFFHSEQQDIQAVLPLVLYLGMSTPQYEFLILIYNELSSVFTNQNI